jgi:hypothetical protein
MGVQDTLGLVLYSNPVKRNVKMIKKVLFVLALGVQFAAAIEASGVKAAPSCFPCDSVALVVVKAAPSCFPCDSIAPPVKAAPSCFPCDSIQ